MEGGGGAMNLNVLIQEDTNSKLSNTFIMKISYTIFLINKKEKKNLCDNAFLNDH